MARSSAPVLPGERPGHAAPPAVLAGRETISAAVAAGIWRSEAPIIEEVLGGVRVLRFRPPVIARGTILHLHGGAFRIGCPEIVIPYAAALAERCGVELVCPAYRLAPEYPFPAGLADARAVMLALSRNPGTPLILSGDSAGGGLAAGLAALAMGDGVALAGLVLLSPWLDLTVSALSYRVNGATDPLFSREAAEQASGLYLQGISTRDPLASPLFAPVDDFPPTYISIGTGEVLADDGRTLHARLKAAGVPSRLHAVAGMDHIAVVRGLDLPGANETFAAIAAFVDRLLAQAADR